MAGMLSSTKGVRKTGGAMWRVAVLCWLSIANLLAAQTAGNTAPLLTNVAQIRKLSFAELATQRPIQLKALVTYYSPQWPILLVQDPTGGIYVELTDLPKIATGNLIQLDAVSGPHGYLVAGKFKVLADKAPWPAPHRPTFEEFDSGKYDSQYILLTGYLYSIGNRSGHFVLEFQGPQNKRFRALIPDDSISLDQLEKWIDCRLELTGVAGIELNGLGVNTGCQLWVADPSHIKVLEKSPADPLVTTPKVIAEIHQFSLRNEPLRRLSVLGVVTR